VPRADRDDVGLEADTGEDDVTDDIENFVADELVLETQGFLADDFITLKDDGRIQRAALD